MTRHLQQLDRYIKRPPTEPMLSCKRCGSITYHFRPLSAMTPTERQAAVLEHNCECTDITKRSSLGLLTGLCATCLTTALARIKRGH